MGENVGLCLYITVDGLIDPFNFIIGFDWIWINLSFEVNTFKLSILQRKWLLYLWNPDWMTLQQMLGFLTFIFVSIKF